MVLPCNKLGMKSCVDVSQDFYSQEYSLVRIASDFKPGRWTVLFKIEIFKIKTTKNDKVVPCEFCDEIQNQ